VFAVRGGNELHGTLRISGAKNSALKLMAASILADGPVTLANVPAIADVPVMADILRGLGAEVSIDGTECRLSFEDLPDSHAPFDAVARIRASISVLGPLVGRVHRAQLRLPGGDRIGARRIDLHLRGLMSMGASVHESGDEVQVHAEGPHGAANTLDFPSVGATENLLMAATLADGTTSIENAAREPEIQDLCHMLVSMGARINHIGEPTLEIEGVERLSGTSWSTCPDRIEAGTYAVAAALTRGDVVLEGVRPTELALFLTKLRAAGVHVEEGAESLRIKGDGLVPINVVTLPYPGFPTDLQPQMMVLLTQAPGESMVTENVFESRFAFVEQLQRMGAHISIDGHHAVIRGASPLTASVLDGLDVRAGAAGVLAGLIADGETIVRDIHHVQRGYHDMVGSLQSLGADIERRSAA
jgi:UDP-N-acetylglucosamine 1-carboxyvinyltransferase